MIFTFEMLTKQSEIWVNVHWKQQIGLKGFCVVLLFCFFCLWMLGRNWCALYACSFPNHNSWMGHPNWENLQIENYVIGTNYSIFAPVDVSEYSTDATKFQSAIPFWSVGCGYYLCLFWKTGNWACTEKKFFRHRDHVIPPLNIHLKMHSMADKIEYK